MASRSWWSHSSTKSDPVESNNFLRLVFHPFSNFCITAFVHMLCPIRWGKILQNKLVRFCYLLTMKRKWKSSLIKQRNYNSCYVQRILSKWYVHEKNGEHKLENILLVVVLHVHFKSSVLFHKDIIFYMNAILSLQNPVHLFDNHNWQNRIVHCEGSIKFIVFHWRLEAWNLS